MLNQNTAIITIILVILSMALARKHRLIPLIVAAVFVPMDQRIIIGGLDFTVLRILIVAIVLRIWLRGEVAAIRWNRFDYLLFAWIICGSIVYSLQTAGMAAVINRCGVMFDLLGLQWICRQCVRSWDDIKSVIKVFAVCVWLFVPLIVVEWITKESVFVGLGTITVKLRLGRHRCQGSFDNAIVMGIFWATLVPPFIGMGMVDKRRRILYIGAVLATVFCVMASLSATPLIVLLLSLPLFCLYKWRRYSKSFVTALLVGLLCLHLIMTAPVWHLIARASVVVGGATGWHRAQLVDQAIAHFGEWALLGTQSTTHWGYGMQDVANQYIIEGLRGGLVTLVFFLAMLFVAVKTPLAFSLLARERERQILSWGITIMLVGHCMAFSAYAYYGQIIMLLYLGYAFVGFIYENAPSVKKENMLLITRRSSVYKNYELS